MGTELNVTPGNVVEFHSECPTCKGHTQISCGFVNDVRDGEAYIIRPDQVKVDGSVSGRWVPVTLIREILLGN